MRSNQSLKLKKPQRKKTANHGTSLTARKWANMMVNRGRLEIMAHILGLCTKPQLKTRVMYDVNITFNQFGSYIALLQSQGLLTRNENRYATTEKGVQFVNAFAQLQSILSGSTLPSPQDRMIKVRQEPKKSPITFYV